MKNIILFGPPGSGKGTQAAILVDKFDLLHISTGDLFRYEMGNDTPLGLKAKSFIAKGELVPDEVTIGMLVNKVDANPDVKGIIFDGFPRTIRQAEALDELLEARGVEVNKVLALYVDEDEIVKRLLERGKTSGRKDDSNEEIIRNRIAVYRRETEIVFEYYDQKDKAQQLDGIGTIEEVAERLQEEVSKL
jgi:adenylate kinase